MRRLQIAEMDARYGEREVVHDVYLGLDDGEIGCLLGPSGCGKTTVGRTVAEAFESMYYLERACQNLVLAYSTGQPLHVLDDELATKVATGWKRFRGLGDAHFAQRMAQLDRTDPDYRL